MVMPTDTATGVTRTNGAALPPEYDALYDPGNLRIAFPPNEEPMADAARLMTFLLALITPLMKFFEKLPGTFVNSDVFLYYDKSDHRKAVAPDVIIAFDVNVKQIIDSGSYHLWVEGKPPEFVMEIGSDKTARRDLDEKRDIYARIGVGEYWLFDPPDGKRYGFILKGLRLVDGEYVEIPMSEGSGSDVRGHSEALGLDFCWEDDAIRLYDPSAGEYLRNHNDSEAALADAKTALAETRAEVRRLRAQLADRNQA